MIRFRMHDTKESVLGGLGFFAIIFGLGLAAVLVRAIFRGSFGSSQDFGLLAMAIGLFTFGIRMRRFMK